MKPATWEEYVRLKKAFVRAHDAMPDDTGSLEEQDIESDRVVAEEEAAEAALDDFVRALLPPREET